MPLTKKGKKIKKSFKKQYGKDADKVFYASANKGTLKGVIKKSKGELIFLLDGDDFFKKNKLTKLSKIFDKNINYTYIGSGRSKYDLIKPETDKPFEFKRGTVAFAKSKNGDAEDSEFLILLADAFLFEGEYTPLGRVINGISALEKIKFNDQSEYVLRPDFINSLKMFSDIN